MLVLSETEVQRLLNIEEMWRYSAEINLNKSVGIALQDVATAQLVYRKALAQKVGTVVEVN